MDVADRELTRMIERRASSDPDPDEMEESYVASVRRFNARRRHEALWDRLHYHEAMMEAHTKTFMQLLDKHKAGRERCEELLGIGGDRG